MIKQILYLIGAFIYGFVVFSVMMFIMYKIDESIGEGIE